MTAASEPRPWVKRLGTYLRIFGVGRAPDLRYIDALARMAQEREAEHVCPVVGPALEVEWFEQRLGRYERLHDKVVDSKGREVKVYARRCPGASRKPAGSPTDT